MGPAVRFLGGSQRGVLVVTLWRRIRGGEALRLVVVDAVMLTRGCLALPWLRYGILWFLLSLLPGLVGCNVL